MINGTTPNPNATEKGPDKETIRQGITQQVNWFIWCNNGFNSCNFNFRLQKCLEFIYV